MSLCCRVLKQVLKAVRPPVFDWYCLLCVCVTVSVFDMMVKRILLDGTTTMTVLSTSAGVFWAGGLSLSQNCRYSLKNSQFSPPMDDSLIVLLFLLY